MTERITSTAIAIVPCNDVAFAESWWNRLGFIPRGGNDSSDYRMLSDGHGAEVHLQRAPEGWVVNGRNPFGIYIYTDKVDEIAGAMRGAIIESGKAPEHKAWGMYEFALNGPDGLLVRIGWPSHLKRVAFRARDPQTGK